VAPIDAEDPDAVETELYGAAEIEPPEPGSFLPMGAKRTVTMLALRHLHDHAPTPADILPLAAGAPFGAVHVDTEGCTLCLACVGACPTGALVDNPDSPMVRFQEEACVQCGLCRATCPESVITLEPRLNFTGEARDAIVLNQEEPFACIRCGKPFGVRSSIERMVEKLAGHSMFTGDDGLDRLKMCEDCRVAAQFELTNPMAAGPRPTTRTTDDDLREREQQKAREMHERAQSEAAAEPDKTPDKSNGGDA
jgi:ferredoxin